MGRGPQHVPTMSSRHGPSLHRRYCPLRYCVQYFSLFGSRSSDCLLPVFVIDVVLEPLANQPLPSPYAHLLRKNIQTAELNARRLTGRSNLQQTDATAGNCTLQHATRDSTPPQKPNCTGQLTIEEATDSAAPPRFFFNPVKHQIAPSPLHSAGHPPPGPRCCRHEHLFQKSAPPPASSFCLFFFCTFDFFAFLLLRFRGSVVLLFAAFF